MQARHLTDAGDWEPFHFRIRTITGITHALGQPSKDDPEKPIDVAHESRSGRGSMDGMLNAMALIVESKFPGNRCSILLVDVAQDKVTVGAGPSLPAEYNSAVEGLEIGPAVGSCGTAAYWNVPVVVCDIGADPLCRNLLGPAKVAGVSACWSQPIRDSGGAVLGAMALYDRTQVVPAKSEIAARMVGLAIERERLEERLRTAQ